MKENGDFLTGADLTIADKTDITKNLYCYDYIIGNFNSKKFVLRIYIQYGDLPNPIKYTPYNPNQQGLCSPP